MAKRQRMSRAEARRIALAASGFDQPRPRKVTAAHIARVIRRLGLLQLDFVNVLVPAHYLVLFSRLGAYDRELFHRVADGSGEFTEQWAREASLIPVQTWPLLRDRMAKHRPRPYPFANYMRENPDYVDWALDQVRERGPLTAADIAKGKAQKMESDWSSTIERAVLEAHFGYGRLAVTMRSERYVRSYDLAARVLPLEILQHEVERDAAHRELIRTAAQACGIASAGDLADYFRMKVKDVRRPIAELVEAGELVAADVEGWDIPGYLWHKTALPRKVHATRLLSPFDPLVWCRARVARLFEFDYKLEIFVPPARRRWGYYVLPFLLGDRLVARVDVRTDRANDALEVIQAWQEEGARKWQAPLAKELRNLARWLGLATVTSRGGLPWLST